MEPSIELWGREHYPRLMENPALIEKLYQRKVLNKPTMVGQVMAFPLEKVRDLKAGKAVSMIVTKVDTTITSREACKECFKSPKNCTNPAHHTAPGGEVEKIALYTVNMLAGDETAMTKFQRPFADKEVADSIENGDVFVMTGSFKIDDTGKWGNEFVIKSFAVLTQEQKDAWDALDDYYSIHGGEGGISEDEFAKVTAGKEELLEPIFERVYISHLDGRVRF